MFDPQALARLKSLRQFPDRVTLPFVRNGKVREVLGSTIEVHLPGAPLGSRVLIEGAEGVELEGEVVGFRKENALVAPLSDPTGVCANAVVTLIEREPSIRVGEHLIGRVLDGYLRPIDGKGPLPEGCGERWNLVREPLNPLERRLIETPLDMGVRAINALLTCGEGQRVGIMAGSGVGKSVLLGMIAKSANVDVNVIGLIGERGREVREFIENCLGEEGKRKSVVIVSTGDQSPLARIRAAHVATAVSEFFRESGRRVLLMMDSLTRVAMAQREIGLSVGEPPTSKGYTPSVFALLPKLLERAGNSSSRGSLTGIYTVLVDGDDFNDPICDAARSILDGHINLKRDLAARNHFPAIDILSSASRVMMDIVDGDHLACAGMLRDLMATYARYEEAIAVGAYESGSNPKLDQAILMMPRIESFLKQDRLDVSELSVSVRQLANLVGNESEERG
jgi:flagellum-specific ATP synthase